MGSRYVQAAIGGSLGHALFLSTFWLPTPDWHEYAQAFLGAGGLFLMAAWVPWAGTPALRAATADLAVSWIPITTGVIPATALGIYPVLVGWFGPGDPKSGEITIVTFLVSIAVLHLVSPRLLLSRVELLSPGELAASRSPRVYLLVPATVVVMAMVAGFAIRNWTPLLLIPASILQGTYGIRVHKAYYSVAQARGS